MDPRLEQILAESQQRTGIKPKKRRRINNAPSADEIADLQEMAIEQLKRKIDGLKLYQPMPKQLDFHESQAKERLIRGANRSGKTTAAAVEVARAITGKDPRYPQEGIAYIVGKDGKEMANVMYKLLFRAGAYKIIRDAKTGEWRAWNPSNVEDFLRKKETKLAPPLVPPRYIKNTVWDKKGAEHPELIRLHNGWDVHCFSSNSLPPHGTQIDLVWFDEEILNQSWYTEMAARLVDREGFFVWSATPQAGTIGLYELHERAEKEAALLPKDKRRIEEFVVTLAENYHLTDEQKALFESKLSADEIMVRVHGEFAAQGFRVFPEMSKTSHLCKYFPIPGDWTTYVAIDPGRQTCAALFVAIPPNGEYAYAFDELYLHQCSAELFGREMARKCKGRAVQAFIIDHQEGRKVEAGSGRTIEEQYSDALDRHRVACARTGTGFTNAAAEPRAGVEAVREWLRPREQQGPRLRILEDTCPWFLWEMTRYWFERTKDGITDKPRERGPVHLCACIRYIVQDRPTYIPPEEKKPRPSMAYQFAKKLMKSEDKGRALNLGPGTLTIGVGLQ
jgi:hypothetical protein